MTTMTPETQMRIFRGLLIEAGYPKASLEWNGDEVRILNWHLDGIPDLVVGKAFMLLAQAMGQAHSCAECWAAERMEECMDGDCTRGVWPHEEATS